MFVFALIVDNSGLTTQQQSIVVINKPEHQLPLFILSLRSFTRLFFSLIVYSPGVLLTFRAPLLRRPESCIGRCSFLALEADGIERPSLCIYGLPVGRRLSPSGWAGSRGSAEGSCLDCYRCHAPPQHPLRMNASCRCTRRVLCKSEATQT